MLCCNLLLFWFQSQVWRQLKPLKVSSIWVSFPTYLLALKQPEWQVRFRGCGNSGAELLGRFVPGDVCPECLQGEIRLNLSRTSNPSFCWTRGWIISGKTDEGDNIIQTLLMTNLLHCRLHKYDSSGILFPWSTQLSQRDTTSVHNNKSNHHRSSTRHYSCPNPLDCFVRLSFLAGYYFSKGESEPKSFVLGIGWSRSSWTCEDVRRGLNWIWSPSFTYLIIFFRKPMETLRPWNPTLENQ